MESSCNLAIRRFSVFRLCDHRLSGFSGRKNELAQKKFREALQFASLNQRNKMMKALIEAIELDPNNANSHFILGREYLIHGDIDKAESDS